MMWFALLVLCAGHARGVRAQVEVDALGDARHETVRQERSARRAAAAPGAGLTTADHGAGSVVAAVTKSAGHGPAPGDAAAAVGAAGAPSSWSILAEAVATLLLLAVAAGGIQWYRGKGSLQALPAAEQWRAALDITPSSSRSRASVARDGGLTVHQATVNLVTAMIGAGVLAFPAVVAVCGWVLAPVFIISAAALNTYCNLLLCRVLEKASTHEPVDCLRTVGEICFGRRGGQVAEFTLCAFVLASCACFIVLIAENMDFLVPWATRPWILASGGLLCLSSLIKDISFLSRLCILGVVASLAYVVCIIASAATAAQTYPPDLRVHHVYPEKEGLGAAVVLFGKFATLLFGFQCSSMLPSFRADMRNPDELPQAIVRANGFCAGVYLVAGLVGYYGFGAAVHGNVLNSMCAAPGCAGGGAKLAAGVCMATAVVVNLAVTVPLNTYVLFGALERCSEAVRQGGPQATLARLGTVLLCTLLALSVPFFQQMVGLVSSVMIVLVVLVLPAVYMRRLEQMEGATVGWSRYAVVLLGVLMGASGLYDAVTELRSAAAANPGALNPFRYETFWAHAV